MEYRLEIEEHGSQKMIHTNLKGIMSVDARNQAAVETVRLAREQGISKIIWDIRLVKLDYTLIDSHQVVMNLPALGVTAADSIAVIYQQDEEQHEHARTVAHNRGIFNLNYFKEISAGIGWLIARG